MEAKDPLAIYLKDHYAAATGGVALINRIAQTHDGEMGAELKRLAGEISADRDILRQLMRRLGVGPSRFKMIGVWFAEKFARIKSNGRIVRRAPLSSVLETEGMLTGVHAKAAGWRSLRTIAEHDSRLDPAEFAALLARAEDQIRSLEQIRITFAQKVFREDDSVLGLAGSQSGTHNP